MPLAVDSIQEPSGRFPSSTCQSSLPFAEYPTTKVAADDGLVNTTSSRSSSRPRSAGTNLPLLANVRRLCNGGPFSDVPASATNVEPAMTTTALIPRYRPRASHPLCLRVRRTPSESGSCGLGNCCVRLLDRFCTSSVMSPSDFACSLSSWTSSWRRDSAALAIR